MAFRDPQAFSSALAALGMLQLQAFSSLNTADPLVSVSNYYLATSEIALFTALVIPGLRD